MGEKIRRNYNSRLKKYSQQNRNRATLAENVMWEKILRKDQTGYRFVRQKPINNFILDFYCAKLKLAIEVDGEYHKYQKKEDEMRTQLLRFYKIKVVRYTNDQILNSIDVVKKDLQALIKEITQPLQYMYKSI